MNDSRVTEATINCRRCGRSITQSGVTAEILWDAHRAVCKPWLREDEDDAS